MERLARPALRAILEAIEGVENATRGKSIEDYHSDWLLRHGIQRGIEIISEAVRRVPPELLATRPEIPWTQITGIGNVLRHEYHNISDPVIWNVVQMHLPPLKLAVVALENALRE
jgi:uncharacterized protein with HEPN domain